VITIYGGLEPNFMQFVLSRLQSLGLAGRRRLFSGRVGQRWIFRANSGYFGREKFTDYSVLWISVALLTLGIGILINAGTGPSQSLSPAQWPTTFGTISSVRIVERYSGSETRWFPEVTYQYSVQGRTVANTRLTRGPETSWRDPGQANEFLARYIARSRVLVYYNPNNISDSVLEPTSGGLGSDTWGGIVAILLALSVLIIYDRFN